MGGGSIHAHNIHWISAGRTHVGKVRKLNEDAFLQASARGVWAIADGMGGHEAGDFASTRLVGALAEVDETLSLDGLVREVAHRLAQTNARLIEEGRQRRARIIGSTVVALLAKGSDCAVLWAGDSRLYRFDGRSLELVTTDHSRVQELIASGRLEPGQAEQHPEANVITRAVGVSEVLELDERRFAASDGDTFLLCSDGLSRYVGEQEMAAALTAASCQQSCERLMQAALQTPARDNISVVVTRASFDDSVLRTRLNTEPVAAASADTERADTELDGSR